MYTSINVKTIGTFKVIEHFNISRNTSVFLLGIEENIPSINLSIIPIEQQAEIFNYRLKIDVFKRLISRSFMYCLLAERFGIRDFTLGFERFKKPYLINYPELKFNISYSDYYIAIGISSNRSIGIDIEQLNRNVDIFQIAKSVMMDVELRKFYDLTFDSEQYEYFFKVFCSKEAFIKALGMGFYFDPTSIEAEYNQPIIFENRFFELLHLGGATDGYSLVLCCEN